MTKQTQASIELMERRNASVHDGTDKSVSVGVRLNPDQYRRCREVQERYALRSVGAVLLHFLTLGLGKEAEYEVNRQASASVHALATLAEAEVQREIAQKKGRKS